MKKLISIAIILSMLFLCGCSNKSVKKTIVKDDAYRVDISLLGTKGPGSTPLIIRDSEKIKQFAEFVNNAPIVKQSEPEQEDADGNHKEITVKYSSGQQSVMSFYNDSVWVDGVIYDVQDNYFAKLKEAVREIEYNTDFVTAGEFLQLLSDVSGIEKDWDTGDLQLGLGITPEVAGKVIDIFLKQSGNSVDGDILSELSLDDENMLYTKEAHDICDAILQKIKG